MSPQYLKAGTLGKRKGTLTGNMEQMLL